MTIRLQSMLLCAFVLALPVSGQAQTYTKTETIEYHDDSTAWVLGQVKRTTTDGVETSRTVYGWKALPTQVYGFDNQLQQTIGYDTTSSVASGQLGTVKTVADGRNNTTTVTNWKRGIPQNIALADGNSVQAEVDSRGWISWVEDELDSRTCYTYDTMGRLASTTYTSETAANTCSGSSKWTATTYTWEWITVAEHGLPAGHWLRRVHTGNQRRNTFYDVLYRPVLVHFYDGANTSATLQTTGTTYDAQGRVTFASYPVGTLEKGSTGVWTEYDALGRVTSTSQDSELGPLTTLTQYLTGFKTQVTNPKLQVTTTSFQTFDAPSMDAPVLIEHPGSTFTHITRDGFGKPSKIRRSNSASPTGGTVALDRDYYYNAKQELCRSVEPETGATLMGYDAAGNLSWSAAGLPMGTTCNDASTSAVLARKAARTYDNRNRLNTLNFPDGRGDQVWTYTATGKPATITTYNGSAQTQPVVNVYGYNRRGLMVTETSGQTGWYTWGLGYGYDTYGNLFNVNYTDGLSIIYAPNAIGQPTQAGTYATNISYHRNGALKQFTYGNGIVHTMSQNARQLPARSTDSGGVLDLGYVYDGNANVASITDYTTGGNQSRTLSYDNLDRLTQAVGPSFGTATYAYNVLDDITRLTVTGGNKPRDQVYNYGAGTHRLDSVTNFVGGATVIGLSYDPQGNLSNKNGQTYDFDYGNRLRNVPGKETYRYDGHGRRVYSFTTSHAVWQYSNAGQLMYSHDNRNNRKTNYVYLQGSLLAMREGAMSGGDGTYTIKYQHTDALGSPIKVTDAAGLTVETSEYEPYGHLANRALTDGPGFTGHVQDAGTGLTYMQQRYYDPQVGRFVSMDPAAAYSNGDWRFFNGFAYAFNSPYTFGDPDGRATKNAFWSGDKLFYNAGQSFNIEGTYTLAGHGNVGVFQVDKKDSIRGIDFNQTYDLMKNSGLQRGQNVFSISCRFGMAGADGKSMAQQLADTNGSRVYGADGWVNYEQIGDTTTLTVWSGRDQSGTQGAFQLFTPGSEGPDSSSAIQSISINTKTGDVTFVPDPPEPVRKNSNL
jgi:RHS repeat-associated protein